MSSHRAQQRVGQSDWQARWAAILAAPRVAVFGLLIVGFFVVFSLKVWDLQFVQGEYYRERAARQSTRPVTVPAARGIIYDSNGTPLVRNIPSFNVTLIPAYLPDDEAEEEQVLRRLSRLVGIPYSMAGATESEDESVRGLREIVDDAGYIYRSVMIKRGVDRDVALVISQQALLLTGVLVEVESTRYYPYGPLVSQMLGYLLPISPEDEQEYVALGYEPATDRIGVAGVEATFEQNLWGQDGQRIVEEDVLGRVIRVVSELAEPVPGDNVYLTLDLELQQFVEDTLRAGMEKPRVNSPRGVAIVMNPQTGEILAMVSLPTYDNNIFTHGISIRDWNRLAGDIHRPTLNHAISDRLPPGSVFKIVMAAAALQEGVIDPYTYITCPGRIVIPNKYSPNDPGLAQAFVCWNRSGHGGMNVESALAHSCDVFFYEVGGGFEETEFEGLGVSRIAQYARMFGFGEPTGVELPAEVDGLVPTADWKRHLYSQSWSTGDTYNLSIGQGYLTVTPLQMLNAANVVANGGTLYRPRIVHHVTDSAGNVTQAFEPEIVRTLSITISQEHWSLVRQGMVGAVTVGTSQQAQIEGLHVAGKTGTAQFCDDIMCGVGYQQPEHAWFLAYASREEVDGVEETDETKAAQVSVIVFLYDGGEGTTAAVPVAHDILEHYFGLDQVNEASESGESTP